MTAVHSLHKSANRSSQRREPHTGLVAGRYALRSRLGRGRLGEIYEAVDTHLADSGADAPRVALQIIDSGVLAHEQFRDRLRDGFARIRAWSHPNLVELLDLGRDGDTFYLTTELLDGASLRRILHDLSPETVDREECLAVLCQVGRPLSHAHARGLVHGDVCPGNVFITRDYAVKLLDFGPIPVSPAAVLAEDLAARAVPLAQQRDDLYGLACLAYELLTGRHPFGGSLLDEARLAGLEPAPITICTRRQWRALELGLSLSPDDPGISVDDFLDEFGVTGAEKLPVAAAASTPDAAARGQRSGRSEALRYAASTNDYRRGTAAGRQGYAAHDRPRRRRWRPWLLAVIAAGLGTATYLNYWTLRNRTAELLATYFPIETPEAAGIDGTIRIDTEQPATVAVGGSVQPATDASDPARTPAISGTEPAADAGATPAAPADGSPETAAAGPSGVGATAGAGMADDASDGASAAAPGSEQTTEPPPAAAPVTPQPATTPSTIGFADLSIRVSENGTAARILVERDGSIDGPAAFDWWITGDSAMRDDDYGDLGRRRETFASGEASVTLYIPIVADNRAEPLERFFVNLALAPGSAARSEAALTTEVVIVDDDS